MRLLPPSRLLRPSLDSPGDCRDHDDQDDWHSLTNDKLRVKHKLTGESHPTGKSRTLPVRLISMAMTGYFRTMIRPRAHRPLSMLKYDPVVKKKVLFLEATKGGRNR